MRSITVGFFWKYQTGSIDANKSKRQPPGEPVHSKKVSKLESIPTKVMHTSMRVNGTTAKAESDDKKKPQPAKRKLSFDSVGSSGKFLLNDSICLIYV